MNQRFAVFLRDAEANLCALVRSTPLTYPLGRADIPSRGVYLLSEGTRHLYVGRSDRIRSRLNEHQRQSADKNAASFAALLARKACGLMRDYSPRKGRTRHPDWDRQFAAAKKRIRRMQIRVVRENRAAPQALLEIYAATALDTPHNDFRNH